MSLLHDVLVAPASATLTIGSEIRAARESRNAERSGFHAATQRPRAPLHGRGNPYYVPRPHRIPATKELPMVYSMVIDGRSVTTGQWDDVINPAKGEPFAQCPRGTQANVEEAVQAAARAFKTWRTDEALRRQKLERVRRRDPGPRAGHRRRALAGAGQADDGGHGEVFGASMWFSYYANLQIEPETLQDDGEKTIKVVRKPLGVVAAITPWNFPVILLSWKLAPAWLAGNTVVASRRRTRRSRSLHGRGHPEVVVPAGVLNVLSGGNELGATLATHPLVRKISFTGSRRHRQEDHGLRGRRPEARHARARRQRPGDRARRRRPAEGRREPLLERVPELGPGVHARSSASTSTRRCTTRSSKGIAELAKKTKVGTAPIPTRSSARSTTRCSSSA
jgi:hypothetical protein